MYRQNKPSWLFIDPYHGQDIFSMDPLQSLQYTITQNNIKEFPPLPPTQQNMKKMQNMKRQVNKKIGNAINEGSLQLLSKQKIISLDQVRNMCLCNVYFDPQNVIVDIKKVFAWNQIYRCKTPYSYIYLSHLFEQLIEQIEKKDFIKRFYEKKHQDFKKILDMELIFKMKTNNWPYIPTKFRQYQRIEDYVPTPSSRTQIIRKRLQSKKVPVDCPDDCVCVAALQQSGRQFCKYTLKDMWVTDCPNKAKRMECNHICPQKMAKCRNAQIKKGDRMKCKSYEQQEGGDFDIEECLAWGIDRYTRTVLYYSLPQLDIISNGLIVEDNMEQKNKFIDKCLLRAINLNGKEGYDIKKACNFIIESDGDLDKIFTPKDRFYAQCIIKNYDLCSDKSAYRIHTKGKGAICIRKQGIQQGHFIVQYYGQLYQPWRWYEKEDFIKSLLKNNNPKDLVPQFYNICLEKHKDEPGGYDLLVVDPIRMGNYSSRFSHSCNPNCGTIVTVSDGKYHIGMYSFRDIEFGEQLTFDYCSFTESKNEHENSICLCGMKQCCGNYLHLDNSRVTSMIDKNNCFLLRTSLILRSSEEFTEQDKGICYKHNIQEENLKQLPDWMKKWISLVLRFMEQEAEELKNYHIKNWTKKYPWALQHDTQTRLKNIQFWAELNKQEFFTLRFQNLFNTIDKIKYFVLSINDHTVPLVLLPSIKVIQSIFLNQVGSFYYELLYTLQAQDLNNQAELLEKLTKVVKEIMQQEPDFALLLFRLFCLYLSHQVKKISTRKSFTPQVLSDVLYLYSFTHTYFTPHEYNNHISEQIEVSLTQILGEPPKDKTPKIDKQIKKYSSQFVWGQLASWFKQTIVNPEASLSQDRRGTLSLPTILSATNTKYPYQKDSRNTFLSSLRQKPYSSWPTIGGCKLSFKNKYKCYGTISFEDFYNRAKFKQFPNESMLGAALDVIDLSLSQKLNVLHNTPEDCSAYQKIHDMFQGLPQPTFRIQESQNGKKKRRFNNL